MTTETEAIKELKATIDIMIKTSEVHNKIIQDLVGRIEALEGCRETLQ